MKIKRNTKFILLTLLFNLIGCNSVPVTQVPDGICHVNGIDSETRACNIPEQMPGESLAVSMLMNRFEQTQIDKMDDAVAKLKMVISSKAFRYRIYAYTYNGELQFNNNEGMSNTETYDVTMKGNELSQNEEDDHEMDVIVTIYYARLSSVVG